MLQVVDYAGVPPRGTKIIGEFAKKTVRLATCIFFGTQSN